MCGKSLSCLLHGSKCYCLCVNGYYWSQSQQQCQQENMLAAKFFDTAMAYAEAAATCKQNNAYLADEVILTKTLKTCVNTKLPILVTGVPHIDEGFRCVTVQLVEGDIQQNRVNCLHKYPFFCIRAASGVSDDPCNNWDRQVKILKETIDIKILIGVVTAVVLPAAIAIAVMTIYIRKLRLTSSMNSMEQDIRIQTETSPLEVPARSNEDEDGFEIPDAIVNESMELEDLSHYDDISSYEWLEDRNSSENPYSILIRARELSRDFGH
ncbi:uncharacterized protein LOC117341506 [Pecten maximus]|uniref:uncharacterized protein LOC117341506 n=1 Tax=Pecten maximus TaxID=6579 RepID=UPI001459126E|nr:uncharacterized protein LOC117341506 [Pecten maximus]